jgi:hypothetical protein
MIQRINSIFELSMNMNNQSLSLQKKSQKKKDLSNTKNNLVFQDLFDKELDKLTYEK